MPGLGRHLFSGVAAAKKGISTVASTNSYLNVGNIHLPLRKGDGCMGYLDLAIMPIGDSTWTAMPMTQGYEKKIIAVTINYNSSLNTALEGTTINCSSISNDNSRLGTSLEGGTINYYSSVGTALKGTTNRNSSKNDSCLTSTMAAVATIAGADVWHRRLGHPKEQIIQRATGILDTGVSRLRRLAVWV